MRVPRVTFTVPLTVVPVSGGGGFGRTRGPAIAAARRAARSHCRRHRPCHSHLLHPRLLGRRLHPHLVHPRLLGRRLHPRRRRPPLLRRLQSRNCPWIQRCRGCRCCRRCLPCPRCQRWSRPFPPRRSSRNRRRRFPQRPRCLWCRHCRCRRARLDPRCPRPNWMDRSPSLPMRLRRRARRKS